MKHSGSRKRSSRKVVRQREITVQRPAPHISLPFFDRSNRRVEWRKPDGKLYREDGDAAAVLEFYPTYGRIRKMEFYDVNGVLVGEIPCIIEYADNDSHTVKSETWKFVSGGNVGFYEGIFQSKWGGIRGRFVR